VQQEEGSARGGALPGRESEEGCARHQVRHMCNIGEHKATSPSSAEQCDVREMKEIDR